MFGDLRPTFDCEYVVDVISAVGGGEAVIGAGSHSKQQLDLIPLRYSETWSFDPSSTIRLLGAHGDELVRSMYIDQQVNTPVIIHLTLYIVHQADIVLCSLKLSSRQAKTVWSKHGGPLP